MSEDSELIEIERYLKTTPIDRDLAENQLRILELNNRLSHLRDYRMIPSDCASLCKCLF